MEKMQRQKQVESEEAEVPVRVDSSAGPSTDEEHDSPGADTQVTWRKKTFLEQIHDAGNRVFSEDNLQHFQQALTTDVDEPVTFTFLHGKPIAQDPAAPSIDVGIYFIQGTDQAQVNMDESSAVAKEKPFEKRASWKALTAGDLLLELEVQRDLSIRKIDKTTEVLAQRRTNRGPPAVVADGIKGLSLTKQQAKTVNICSDNVTMLNSLSPTRGQRFDLVATCIEVDGTSLLNLIYNFRDLIANQGEHARLSPEATVEILETMIEGARRLLVRSPILTRAAQRTVIQEGENTRYGLNNGTKFHTFTTSRGIAEMISQGYGYYSALQTSPEDQKKIRPRFLQMIVFLLSLLNNKDLERLRPALEKNYGLKADRQSMELTVFKVLTYYSVGHYLFINSVLNAYYERHLELSDKEKDLSALWDKFVMDISLSGWLIPGSIERLGRDEGSWIVKWKKDTCSDVFDYIQYTGEKDAVNDIPPLRIYSESQFDQDVSAEFRIGRTYHLSVKVLDNVTLAMKGQYFVTDPVTNAIFEIDIQEEEVFGEIYKASRKLETICASVNASRPLENGLSKRRFLGKQKQTQNQRFNLQQPAGRWTKHTTIFGREGQPEQVIGVAWKLDGRKITFVEFLKGVTDELNILDNTVQRLREFADQQRTIFTRALDPARQQKMILSLKQNLQDVEDLLRSAHDYRKRIQVIGDDLDDEPIVRVHFPNHVHWKQDLPWCDYEQTSDANGKHSLILTAQRYQVTADPQWTGRFAEIQLSNDQIATVTPLTDVGEDTDEEVQKDDIVLLVGSFVLIVEQDGDYDKVVNFMKLTALTSTQRRRRGRDKSAKPHVSLLV